MRILFVFFLLFSFNEANSQNLVPNPSFEDTVNCNGPWNCVCSLEIAYPWFNPTTGTSDYFTNSINCGYPSSNQTPRTGHSYIGIYGYLITGREYIEVQLNTVLLAGEEYCLQFYLSRNEGCGGAIDRIGAYFSIDSLLSNNPSNFNLIPHIESTSGILLTDTSQWILIEGSYIAQGGENFLTLGNFRDTSSCIFQIIDTNNFICSHAYYFVDDVQLNLCDSSNALYEENTNSDFKLINSEDFYILNFTEPHDLRVEIYNTEGVNLNWKIEYNETQVIIKKDHFIAGIYILNVTYNNINLNFKIII